MKSDVQLLLVLFAVLVCPAPVMGERVVPPIRQGQPLLHALVPASGREGDTITVVGANFGRMQNSSVVTFNGAPASVVSWSPVRIVALVPPGATSGPVVVTRQGVTGNAVMFTVIPTPPVIAAVEPVSGAVGQIVTITGSHFGASQDSGAVTFAGVAATTISSWTDTIITVRVPVGAASGQVVVAANGLASNGLTFTVLPPPVITSMNPAAAPPGYTVSINGTGFGASQASSSVTFNGVDASAIASWSDSEIAVVVPDGAASGPVLVTVNGVLSNALYFTVVAPPVIISIAPAAGAAGQAVTIAGTNFEESQGASAVLFNGAAATVTRWSDSSITASVPAAATTGPVVVSVGGYASNGVMFTVIGPRISSSLSPGPNDFGWNDGAVTVTFTCTATDSPISFCTPPQTISFSGAGIKVTGRAIDQNGVTATMVVVVNVDLVGPVMNVYSPRASAVFPPGTTSVPIRGNVVDTLSGAGPVTCAGMPALVVGQNFSCSVEVHDGASTVQVVASDVAGRTTSKTVPILVADVAPASLTISPATLTLLAGSSQPLAVTDDRGRSVTTGAWASSDPTVAGVSVDGGGPAVQALAAGTATLTISLAGLSAQAVVTVLAADSTPPDGTTLWSLAPTPNPRPGLTPGLREVIRAVPIVVTAGSFVVPPALFFVERGPYYQNQSTTVVPTVIRAVSADGREAWTYTLPADPVFGGYSPVKQVVPDDRGGIIVVMSTSQPQCCYVMNEVLQRIDGLSGEVTWEYRHRETFARFSEIALHPSGMVFVVEKMSNANSNDLVAIDGLLGQEVARYDLTGGNSRFPAVSTSTGPVVQDDGSVVVVVSRWDNVNSSSASRTAYRATLPSPLSTSLLFEQLRHADGTAVSLGAGDIMSGPWPDGQGGLIVGDISTQQTSGLSNIVHIGGDLVTSPTLDLPFGTAAARDLQYILSDNAAYVLVQYWEGSGQTGATAYKLNPQTLGVLDLFSLPGGPYVQFTSAIAGGGTLYSSHLQGDASQIGYGLLSGWIDAVPVVQTGMTSTTADSHWPYRRGVTSRNDAGNPRLGIFVKGQFVIAPFFHTSLRIVPRDQNRWAGTPGFNQDAFGAWFVTIGAESDTGNCSGVLKSDLNRPRDVDLSNSIYRERVGYSLNDEEVVVRGLLQSDSNYLDELFYACKPLTIDDTYNSNSYTHGLLDKAGLASPLTPFLLPYLHFGWLKPVPSGEFDSN